MPQGGGSLVGGSVNQGLRYMMQIIMAGGRNQGSVMGGGTATGERYSLVLEGKAMGNMTTFVSDSTGYRERVEKFANVMGL